MNGYGADAELVGSTLHLTATGTIGRGALGTDARDIDVSQLDALSFSKGNMVKNGRIELVDDRGKSVIHFRRKGNDRWRSLYERLVELAPSGADDAQASIAAMEAWMEKKAAAFEAGLDAAEAWADRKIAKGEAKRAAKEAKKGAAPQAAPPAATPQASGPADDLRQLAKLREEGLVTEDEYEAKRQEVLKRL